MDKFNEYLQMAKDKKDKITNEIEDSGSILLYVEKNLEKTVYISGGLVAGGWISRRIAGAFIAIGAIGLASAGAIVINREYRKWIWNER